MRRPKILAVEHPEHGTALVRDRKPMQEEALGQRLYGTMPGEWYEYFNRRVFF